MRLDKLTTKSQEALQQAQALAEKRNHQAIDVEHLLFALLGQKEGVVTSLLQKLGVPLAQLDRAAAKSPRSPAANHRRRRPNLHHAAPEKRPSKAPRRKPKR